MKIAILEFPGSNCDVDLIDAFKRHFSITLQPIWHAETTFPKLDGVLIPGGFSFGDYLRSGALAAHSHCIQNLKDYAKQGRPIFGICNGFQVLTESHLLPGALLRNESRKFICRYTWLTPSGAALAGLEKKPLHVPIAHGEGRYYIGEDGLKSLQDKEQIAFRYCDESASVKPSANPNGSVDSIAGVTSENGRILGMMPHPERATDELIGGSRDGLAIFETFFNLAAR